MWRRPVRIREFQVLGAFPNSKQVPIDIRTQMRSKPQNFRHTLEMVDIVRIVILLIHGIGWWDKCPISSVTIHRDVSSCDDAVLVHLLAMETRQVGVTSFAIIAFTASPFIRIIFTTDAVVMVKRRIVQYVAPEDFLL